MSLTQVKVNCKNCTLEVVQDIDLSGTNYIYCPGCDYVFEYIKESSSQAQNVEESDDFESNDPVYQNLKKAYEEIPHTLIRSDSIFLKGYINGTEITFLLDTGAEMSVLPINIVEACGLMPILNKEYSGVMKGVGSDKILGKIHYVEVVLDCGVYPCAFTVCSNNDVPPILGIDMMYNLGIMIDFKTKKIHFSPHCAVDFISKKHSDSNDKLDLMV